MKNLYKEQSVKQVMINLYPWQDNLAAKIAQSSGISKSALIRAALMEYLEEEIAMMEEDMVE